MITCGIRGNGPYLLRNRASFWTKSANSALLDWLWAYGPRIYRVHLETFKL
jgi:hypothetical protein